MSICDELSVPIPSLPFPFTAPTVPNVAINIGTPGLSCCAYTLPGYQFNVQLPIPGLAVALMAYFGALNGILGPAYAALDSFHVPICQL
jgi:hypothetical protein